MTEQEKMHSGDLYLPDDPDIVREQTAFDGAGGGHVLESRGLHRAVDGAEFAPTGRVLLFQKSECGE